MNSGAAKPGPAVAITPCPTAVGVGQGTAADGTVWVLLMVGTQTGQQVFHLTADNAKLIGAALIKLGEAGQLIVSAIPPQEV